MVESLVEILNYQSPTYTQTFDREVEADEGHRFFYNNDPKDKICEWLKNNSLCTIPQAVPGEVPTHTGYLINGQDGSSCIVRMKFYDFSDKSNEERKAMVPEGSRDRPYKVRLTIRSQPANRSMPRELRIILSQMNYEKIKEL
ncbi:MAG: hypothetical protein AABW73_02045 [Nanoarchaeota archaeon]|mgnify:CR=1 FL=1